jgi:hypothetical protein
MQAAPGTTMVLITKIIGVIDSRNVKKVGLAYWNNRSRIKKSFRIAWRQFLR